MKVKPVHSTSHSSNQGLSTEGLLIFCQPYFHQHHRWHFSEPCSTPKLISMTLFLTQLMSSVSHSAFLTSHRIMISLVKVIHTPSSHLLISSVTGPASPPLGPFAEVIPPPAFQDLFFAGLEVLCVHLQGHHSRAMSMSAGCRVCSFSKG